MTTTTAWAAKSPAGAWGIDEETISLSKKRAHRRFYEQYHWTDDMPAKFARRMRRRGWRIVKVKITETEE